MIHDLPSLPKRTHWRSDWQIQREIIIYSPEINRVGIRHSVGTTVGWCLIRGGRRRPPPPSSPPTTTHHPWQQRVSLACITPPHSIVTEECYVRIHHRHPTSPHPLHLQVPPECYRHRDGSFISPSLRPNLFIIISSFEFIAGNRARVLPSDGGI